MPTYTITDPKSGQKLKLTGDSPPTEAELEEIFSSRSGGAPNPVKAAPPAATPVRPNNDMVGNSTFIDFAGLAKRAIGTGEPIPQEKREAMNSQWAIAAPEERAKMLLGNFGTYWNSPERTNDRIKTVATGVRMIPVAAAIAFPPTSLAGFAALAGTGGASELAARQIEGKEIGNREAAAEATKAAVLAGMPMTPVKASASLAPAIGRGLLQGGASMATEAVGETARQSIEQGRFATYDSLANAVRETALAGALGTMLGGTGSRLGGVAEKKAAFEAREQLLKEIGVKNPTLAMRHPRLAAWEQRVAETNPELAAKMANARSDITREFYAQIGDLSQSTNPELAKRLQSLIPQADAAEAAYKLASEQAQQARVALAKAEQATNLPPAELAQIRSGAATALLNATNAQAEAAFRANASFGDVVSNTAKAQELSGVLGNLFDARTAISTQKYAAAGIPLGAPLFSKAELLAAANAKLGPEAKTGTGLSILSRIRDSAAEKVATPAGEAQMLTLSQLRDMRNHLASDFANAPQGSMDNAERLAREAYDAMTDMSRGTIAEQFGVPALDLYDEANRFWRETAEIKNGPLGRSLLQRQGAEPADSTLQGLASGMVHGNVDELTKFKDFVGAIGESDPAVAKLAIQTMEGALKNAFLTKHTKGGSLDFNGLLNDLANSAKYDRIPFPVANLGFGSTDTIRQWQSVLKTFKPEDINAPGVIDGVLANPAVQAALKSGGTDAGRVLKSATAQELFGRELERQVALQAAGRTRDARLAADAARNHALTANIAQADADRILKKVQSDPVLSAFSGMGSYRLTDEAEKLGEGTVTHLLRKMPRSTATPLMGALRENNPQMAELVERRLVADAMKGFVTLDRAQPSGAGAIDTDKVRDYFNRNQPDWYNSDGYWLESVLGKDKTTRLRSFVTKLGDISDQMRQGRMPGDQDIRGVLAATGASVAQPITPLQRSRFINALIGWAERGSYSALAKVAGDPEFAKSFYQDAGDISKVISSLPTQKAYLLMLDKPLTEELASSPTAP